MQPRMQPGEIYMGSPADSAQEVPGEAIMENGGAAMDAVEALTNEAGN